MVLMYVCASRCYIVVRDKGCAPEINAQVVIIEPHSVYVGRIPYPLHPMSDCHSRIPTGTVVPSTQHKAVGIRQR